MLLNFQHACSDKPQHETFNPERTALQKYEDFDYQPLYFVTDSILDAVIKLRYPLILLLLIKEFSFYYSDYFLLSTLWFIKN